MSAFRRLKLMKRILLVEDDPSISFLVTEILRHDGFEVVSVSDGYRALELLKQGSYDAAVLDVMLPGLDGITILKSIRGDAKHAAMKILMLTANADDETTWAGWKAGCDYFLPKPFDPDELVEILIGFWTEETAGSRG